MLRFLPLSLRYIARRKMRTVFTVLAILFGVMVMFGTWTAMPAIYEAKILSMERTSAAGHNAESDTSLNLSVALMNSFGAISLFVGGFLIFNTYRAVLAERQRDLALLRIVGAESHHISQLILIEALFHGVAGSLLGLLSGWGFAIWLIRFIYNTGILPYVDVPTLTMPRPDALLAASALGIGTAIASAYIPARRARLLSPLAGLRPPTLDMERRSTRVGWAAGFISLVVSIIMLTIGSFTATLAGFFVLLGVTFIMPGMILLVIPCLLPRLRRFFPRSADMACSNIMRQPGRTAVTANSLMVAFAVFIASVVMVDSMYEYLMRLFTFHLASDYLVVDERNLLTMITSNMDAQKVLDREMVAGIRALPEVESLMGVRVGEASYQSTLFMMIGIDPLRAETLRPTDFAAQTSSTEEVLRMLQDEQTMFVTLEVARDLGVELGDRIPLTATSGTIHDYRVVGIVADMTVGTGKLGAVISQDNLRDDFGIQDDLVLYLNLVPGADAASVRQLVQEHATMIDVATFRNMGISGVTDFTKSVYIFAGIVIIPALLGLINTLVISVHERTREIGIMRAIGSEQELILRIVLVETLFLCILGGMMGIIAGLICGRSLIALFSPTTLMTSLGTMQFQFPAAGILITLIFGPAIALLTSLSPARRAARLSIVDALRFE